MDKQAEEDFKILVEYLKRGTLLLDLQDLDQFHFYINSTDKASEELATIINTEGVKPENYETNIRPKAVKILEVVFTDEKKSELHKILSEVEAKFKDNDEVLRIILASKLFIEDKKANHSYLPLAVARLLEDIYSTFFINKQPMS